MALRRTGSPGEAPQGYRDENFEVEFDSYVARYRGRELRLTVTHDAVARQHGKTDLRL